MKSRLTAVVLAILLPASALADSYFVDEPTVIGVSKNDAAASSELVRAALQENPKDHLVSSDADAKYIETQARSDRKFIRDDLGKDTEWKGKVLKPTENPEP